MTTDVEQLLIAQLNRIETKVDALANEVAEGRGAHKLLGAIAGVVGGVVGALLGRWSAK